MNNPTKIHARDFRDTTENIHMVNRHMKRCSKTCIIGKIKLKQDGTTLPLRWLNFEQWHQMLVRMENNRNSFIRCWWECKMVQPLCITVWQFLSKLNMLLFSDLATKILAIYPSLYLHTHRGKKKKNCTGMLMAILFWAARNWLNRGVF